MDPAQGESGGGKSLTSKLKAKVPHPRVKSKVKNLKNFLPGMKKHNGDEEPHEDSSEYDENSPRGTGAETGYNVSDSTPFTTTKTTPDSNSPREVHNSNYDARPTGYDAQYMSSPPTRPAPLATDSSRSNLAPTLEEKFQYLDTRDKTRSPQTVVDSSLIDRGHRPEQYQNHSSSPYTPSDRSYQPSSDLSSTPVDRSYEPKPQQPSSYSTSTPIDRSYEPKPQEPSYNTPSTESDQGYEPKPQQPPSYSSSTPFDRSYEPKPEQPSSYSSTTPIDPEPQQPSSYFSSTPIDPEPQQPSSYFSSTPTDRSYEPKPSSYSPTAESVQKGYSDVPRNSYRATSMPNSANKGMLDKVKGTVAGATAMLGDKMGYYNDHAPADPNAPSIVDKAKSTLGMDKPRDPNAPSILDKAKSTLGVDKPRDPNAPSIVEQAKSTLGMDKPRDPNAPSIVDKAKSTLGLDKPRDPNAPSILEKAKSTLGMDKPRDPNAPPLTERAKSYMAVASQKTREYSATAADRAAWTKDRVAAQTTPTHHDKALSEQVTQSLSALPAVLKERLFGTASGPSANSSSSPSIVNRVSGAVSSLFSSPPKDTQHTFPAHSDYHAAPADRSSVPERMPATSAYPTVNN